MSTETVSAKDMKAIQAIAETSEKLLKTDKAVHDGFVNAMEKHANGIRWYENQISEYAKEFAEEYGISLSNAFAGLALSIQEKMRDNGISFDEALKIAKSNAIKDICKANAKQI